MDEEDEGEEEEEEEDDVEEGDDDDDDIGAPESDEVCTVFDFLLHSNTSVISYENYRLKDDCREKR